MRFTPFIGNTSKSQLYFKSTTKTRNGNAARDADVSQPGREMHGPPLHLWIIASSLPNTVCSLILPIFCNPLCCCDAGSFLDWKFPLNWSYFLSNPNHLLHKRGKKKTGGKTRTDTQGGAPRWKQAKAVTQSWRSCDAISLVHVLPRRAIMRTAHFLCRACTG